MFCAVVEYGIHSKVSVSVWLIVIEGYLVCFEVLNLNRKPEMNLTVASLENELKSFVD